MSTVTHLVTGDTASVIRVALTDQTTRAPLNLTGSTVRLHWIRQSDLVLQVRVMTVTDPLTGVATYNFAAGEIEAPSMEFEVEITNSSSKILTSTKTFKAKVREQLG